MRREGKGPLFHDFCRQRDILGDDEVSRGADLADRRIGHVQPRPHDDAGKEGTVGKTKGAVGHEDEGGLCPLRRPEEDFLDRSGGAVGIEQDLQGSSLRVSGEGATVWAQRVEDIRRRSSFSVHPTQRGRRGQGRRGRSKDSEPVEAVWDEGGAEGRDPLRPEEAGGYRAAQTRSGWAPMRETRRERARGRGMSRVWFVERRRIRRTMAWEDEGPVKMPRIWMRSSLW